MKNISFIGVGVMGNGMVLNLIKAGYKVTVYTRTAEKAQLVIERGAQWAASITECIRNADAVITMVGYPKDVEEVYFSEGGILANAPKGTYLIDMTTTRPNLAIAIHEKAEAAGLHAMDAPVSGGDVGAKNGTLSIMVGANEGDFNVCKPLFEAMGSTITLQGPAGSGQYTKMCNQIAGCGTLASLCEAIIYSQKVGIDSRKMIASVSKGAFASRQMDLQSEKILNNDSSPGFYIKHYIKDLEIAKESAGEHGLQLPIVEKLLEMFKLLENGGMGEEGTQALIKYYTEMGRAF